jgi:hypothetical protein
MTRVHACAPCSHFARPCDLFERRRFQAGADDPEEQRDEGLEDNLAICQGSNFSIKRRAENSPEESEDAYAQMMEGTLRVFPAPSSEKGLDGRSQTVRARV